MPEHGQECRGNCRGTENGSFQEEKPSGTILYSDRIAISAAVGLCLAARNFKLSCLSGRIASQEAAFVC
jgi:hypothetical protein